jgi:hypothetical protein
MAVVGAGACRGTTQQCAYGTILSLGYIGECCTCLQEVLPLPLQRDLIGYLPEVK